jgi:hypothetical protein
MLGVFFATWRQSPDLNLYWANILLNKFSAILGRTDPRLAAVGPERLMPQKSSKTFGELGRLCVLNFHCRRRAQR